MLTADNHIILQANSQHICQSIYYFSSNLFPFFYIPEHCFFVKMKSPRGVVGMQYFQMHAEQKKNTL